MGALDTEEQFVKWWTSAEPEILAIGGSYLGSRIAAEDIAQDVAYAAFSRFSLFDDFHAFRKWTKTRTMWLALDTLRIRKREIPASDLAIDLRQIAHTWHTADSPGFTGDERRFLFESIAKLAPKQQEVVLRKLQGHSTKDIAKKLGIERSTVRSLFRHAKHKLSQESTQARTKESSP